jgi:RHS repeat-associated protein
LIKLSNFADKNNNDIFDNGEGISEFSYLLDNLGRKDYAFEKFWTEYGERENEIDWEYDEAGRLIYEKFDHYNDEFDQTSEWLYDLVGNRLKQTINGTITTYNYDVNDRLLNEVTNNKITIYDYKQTQQTSKKVSENGILILETTFEYDAQGRMSVVTVISENYKEITKYKYGTDGIRVSAEHEVWEDNELKSKTKTEYLNDPLNITGYSQVVCQKEYDVYDNLVKETTYVIGNERISQTVTTSEGSNTLYFTRDGHGSTRVAIDTFYTVLQIYHFDAFGNALGFDPKQVLTEFLFSGEQFDSKIGQLYLRARYYDPVTGRFNQLDPFFGNLNDPQSLHKYLYTHADPVNGFDPTGWMTLGSCISALGSGLSMAASRLGAGLIVYDRASTVIDIVQISTQLMFTGTVNPMQLFGVLLSVIPGSGIFKKVSAFLPSMSTMTNFVGKVKGASEGLTEVWKQINRLPGFDIAFNVSGDLASALTRNKRLVERIGEVGAGVVANKLGFIAVPFKPLKHGIDGIFKYGDSFVVVEAKGGVSRLGQTLQKSGQMSRDWIEKSIKELLDSGQDKLAKEFAEAQASGKMYGMIVRTPIDKGTTGKLIDATIGEPEYALKHWNEIGETIW